jgi:microcystin-dependent protein
MATKGKIKIYEDNNYNDFYPLTVSSQVVDLKTNVVNIIKETLSFRKANTSYNLDDKVILNEDFIGIYLICIKQGITAKTDLSYLTDDVEDNEIIIDGTVNWKVHRSAGINSFKTTAFLDSAQNWKTNNPILEKGQIALEEDTGFVKIGDGINTWNFLSYIKDSKLDAKLDKNGTAQKAIKDELNNKIDETYIKKISVDGSTLTFTKGNNISSSITLQNGSYPLATQINDGLMSKEDKIKLDNVNLNSEENQNTFSNISVGATIISADQKTDTLTLKSGQNINLSANNLDDSITIAFTGTVDNANNAIKSKQDYLGQNIHETYIKNIQGNNNKLTIVKGNDVSSIINIDNVPNAIKATQDSRGQKIDTTYIKNISVSDNTLTIYKGDGSATNLDIISFDQIYPIGAIYMSTVSTNPATLFKIGNWEALPAGRVLLAQGTSTWGVNYSAGGTGGEDKHTLTVSESAPHNHTGNATTSGSTHTHALTMRASHGKSGNGGVPRFGDGDVWSDYKTQNLSAAGEHSHAITINNSGGGQAHNNMQPYLSVYMWKRTS